MKKLNYWNVLKLIGKLLLAVACLVLIFILTTSPRVPRPTTFPNDDVVRLRIPAQAKHETRHPTSAVEYFGGDQLLPLLVGKDYKLMNEESKFLRLAKESARLEDQIDAMKKYNSELQVENENLQKLNHDIQERMIAFIDRNRLFDMVLSALIGAVVSIAMTYYLELTNIRRRLSDYIFRKSDQ